MKILFLGGGNMANALIGGMVKQGYTASDIHVIDPGSEARGRLAGSYGVICHEAATQAPAAPDVLVLAVKPQQMKEAVTPLVGRLGNALVISIAAGLDKVRFVPEEAWRLDNQLDEQDYRVQDWPIGRGWLSLAAPTLTVNGWLLDGSLNSVPINPMLTHTIFQESAS